MSTPAAWDERAGAFPGADWRIKSGSMASWPAKSALATATAAAAATRTFLARAGDVHGQIATVQIGTIHSGEGFLSLLIAAHRNETEPARAASGSIDHQVRFKNGSVRRERVLQVIFSGVEGEISDEQFIIHSVMLV